MMTGFNKIIHQPVRLRIMAALVALDLHDEIDFSFLSKLLDVTDGNLGAHLRKLEDSGYILIKKTFVERKPRTYVVATEKGRKEFSKHVAALEAILKNKD